MLGGFSDVWSALGDQSLRAIHATFVTVGLMTLASALVFSQLDGDESVRPAPDSGD